ncbi:MAG: hypothetical protein LIV22_02225 [Olegusella sp.]|jgi:hypothetical protein|nr:hypothetical protein [Olegusella sp.]
MPIIPIGDIVDVNKLLASRHYAFKVHLHDTCGAQVFELRSADGFSPVDDDVRSVVRDYFASKHIDIGFFQDGMTFHTLD